jgi:hypothetical protein
MDMSTKERSEGEILFLKTRMESYSDLFERKINIANMADTYATIGLGGL